MEFMHAYSQSFRGSDIECKEPTLAQQQFKDDADINVLLERFKVTGQLPEGVRLPTYGDFSQVVDFRTAQDAIRRASASFMDLPANVRARFQNDPQEFLEFCSNKDNLPELRKLGLAPEAVQAVEVGMGREPHVAPAGGVTPPSEGRSNTA